MFYVTFFVLILTQTVYSQTELIDSIVLDPTKYLPPNTTQKNYCSNSSFNACESKNCVNGTYPPFGYTCQKPDTTLLRVDYVSQTVYEKINDFMTNTYSPSAPLECILDIKIDSVEVSLTYIYKATRSFSTTDVFLIKAGAPAAIRSNFASLVGFSIGSDRVVVDVIAGSPTFTIKIYFPSKSSWVTWNSSKKGVETTLAEILLTDVGKNPSSPGDQIRLVVQYGNKVVYSKWIEDFSQPIGTDTTYLELACNSYGHLLNGTVKITPSGFAYDSSLNITDRTCVYIPPPTPPSQPPATPSPPTKKSASNSLETGLWGFLFCSLFSRFFIN